MERDILKKAMAIFSKAPKWNTWTFPNNNFWGKVHWF